MKNKQQELENLAIDIEDILDSIWDTPMTKQETNDVVEQIGSIVDKIKQDIWKITAGV